MPIASWSSTKGSTSTSSARPTTGRLVAWSPGNEPDNPTSDQLAKSRKQQADATAKQVVATQPKQGTSLFSKVKNGAKEFASGATQGEQKFAQGIARVLPGGTNDLKAEAKSSQADQQNLKTYSDLHEAGKLTDKQYQKATQTVANQSNQTSKTVKDTEKSMPTKAQIALGAASTAADTITAGELPEIKAAALGTKTRLAANVGAHLASNAAAGGLNAAAAGGSKGDVIKNAAFGAALPEVLHQGGQVATKGVTMVADKLGVGGKAAAKELVTNTQTKSLLDRVRQSQGAEPEPTPQPELHPDTAKALHDTMATVHQPKAALEADAAKQAATEAAGKQSEQAAKDAEKATADTKKIDQQLEVYDAKAKDAKDGKLSNVDQVKVKQLKEQKAEVAQALPEQTPIAKPANVITVEDHDYQLSGASQDAYDVAKAKFDKKTALYAKDKSEFGRKQLKAAGMQFSVEKRRIIRDEKGVTDHEATTNAPEESFRHDPSQAKFKGLQPNKQFPNSYDPAKLSDVLDYPALFKQHPELKDYTLKYHDVGDMAGATEGTHNPKTKTITLDKSLPDNEKLPALMHEIQHAIQAKEGRLDGQSSTAKLGYHGYKDNPIEVEARQVGDQYKTKPVAATPTKPTPEATTSVKPETRPSDALQTQIEQAHNAGDSAKEAELVKQLPDQGMNPNATITPERRAELMAKMRGDASPASEQKTVKPKSESEFKSRVYERLKEQHPDELKDDVGYDAINLKDQAEKATKLLTEDKQKAYRVATGQEVSSDLTATSANIALSQQALDEGNTKLYESLVRNRSLAQTRRGQELVSEKASVSDNSTDRYVKQLLADRLNQLGTKHTFGISLKKTSAKETAVGVIDKEVKKLDTQIRNKKLDTKTALALLDKMECL